MITVVKNIFKLDSEETSYLFRVLDTGHLEQLYYGKKIQVCDDYSLLFEKHGIAFGNTVAYDQSDVNLCLEQLCLEFSTNGKGDFREPILQIKDRRDCRVSDFVYVGHQVYSGKKEVEGLPSSYGACETLEIILEDRVTRAQVVLHYSVFERCDCIVRRMSVIAAEQEITLERALSMQLDLPGEDYSMVTFNGAWVREMQGEEKTLSRGIYVNDSKTGVSSNHHNPFVILKERDCVENSGGCYGVHLIYSGNHCEIAEVNPYGRTRILSGINPHCFSRKLRAGERFETPESVMSYARGTAQLSKNFHAFINEHIVRGHWKNKTRPVLLNSWEANYFDIDEEKILQQARKAQALGFELFVIDDGWFEGRNDDTSSLGDWAPDHKKFPNGFKTLSEEFEKIGIGMGLWIEPEMVSENSGLFREHPDWALCVPGLAPSCGRNQLVLDLSRDDVCEHLISTIIKRIQSAKISYIKWDMNRNLSDVCSALLSHNGDLYHRFTLGYYKLAAAITGAFPEILFEGCSAGGNRFDLGVMCYMPQIWASDNTDAHCRMQIQRSVSFGYPQSVVGAHVSALPNAQTGRLTSLQTRFGVAAFGMLGYELDLFELSEREQNDIARQIAWYKQHRGMMQFGQQYRLTLPTNYDGMMVVDDRQQNAVVLMYQTLHLPNDVSPVVKLTGLDEARRYTISEMGADQPFATANGDLLMNCGMKLERFSHQENGAGIYLPDFGVKIFCLKSE